MTNKEIKRAVKLAKQDVKDNSLPRSNDRRVGYWAIELLEYRLLELIAEQAQREVEEAKGV